jgi:hypothetical protein
MSSLRKFRSWVGASRRRFTLFWAIFWSAWMLMCEVVWNREIHGFAQLALYGAVLFGVGYLVSLFVWAQWEAKRTS